MFVVKTVGWRYLLGIIIKVIRLRVKQLNIIYWVILVAKNEQLD